MSRGTVIRIEKIENPEKNSALTIVRLKGCPLRCTFCGKPESMKKTPEFTLQTSNCSLCGHCVSVCETNALYLEDDRVIFNPQSCRMCDTCQNTCPGEAIRIIGEHVDDADLSREILKDAGHYDRLGIVLNGGEPFMQASFTYNLLAGLKNAGVETALSTSGYAPWEYLENTAPYVDHFIYNLKHMDNERHTKATGVGNSLILENFVKLSKMHNDILVRYKVVPGINDSEENARQMFQFMADNGVKRVLLSSFDGEDVSDYYRWKMGNAQMAFAAPEKGSLAGLRKLAEEYGLTVVNPTATNEKE